MPTGVPVIFSGPFLVGSKVDRGGPDAAREIVTNAIPQARRAQASKSGLRWTSPIASTNTETTRWMRCGSRTIVPPMIVGFLGSGNMAAAMARGWAGSGAGAPERMLFTDSGSGRAQALATDVGGEVAESNGRLAEASDLLVLAVKPKDLEAVAADAQAAPGVLSMLGATPVARVAAAFPSSAAMRLMPNLGVAGRSGVMCFAAAADVSEDAQADVLRALGLLGRVEV